MRRANAIRRRAHRDHRRGNDLATTPLLFSASSVFSVANGSVNVVTAGGQGSAGALPTCSPRTRPAFRAGCRVRRRCVYSARRTAGPQRFSSSTVRGRPRGFSPAKPGQRPAKPAFPRLLPAPPGKPGRRSSSGPRKCERACPRCPTVMCRPSLHTSSRSSVLEWNAPALACEWIVPKISKPAGTATDGRIVGDVQASALRPSGQGPPGATGRWPGSRARPRPPRSGICLYAAAKNASACLSKASGNLGTCSSTLSLVSVKMADAIDLDARRYRKRC